MDYLNQKLGSYRLIRRLSQGSYGKVYLGEHLHLGTYAAIKILHEGLEKEEEQKFRDEARILARLSHANIARIIDFNIHNGTSFLVMEYAPKGSLRFLHAKGTKLPLDTIVEYVKQIAAALQHAHNNKVVHRDIKPGNILLGENNRILLCDFGIAISVSGSHKTTGGFTGTAAYMAPEQIQGKPSFASDQYALGVVVYEWLCGEPPFNGGDVEISVQHVNAHPPSLREKVPAIPPAIEIVVLTALKKEPSQRYGSVKGFADALEQAHKLSSPSSFNRVPPPPSPVPVPSVPPQPGPINHVPIVPPPLPGPLPPQALPVNDAGHAPPPIVPPSPSPVQPVSLAQQAHFNLSSRGVPRRTALEIIAGACVLGTWSVLAPKAWALIHPSVSSTPVPTRTPATTPIINAYGQGDIHLVYNGHSDVVTSIAWSPSGDRIASVSFDKTVRVWDAKSGLTVWNKTGHTDSILGVAWSPDGKYIASCSMDKTVNVWDAKTGTPLPSLTGHTDKVSAVAWSPDSTYIAASSFDGSVIVWQWDGTNRHTNTVEDRRIYAVAWSPTNNVASSPLIAASSQWRIGEKDAPLYVWKATLGDDDHDALYNKYEGNEANGLSIAWSPNGMFLVSGAASNDNTVKVWAVSEPGKPKFTLRGHTKEVNSVAWSPDNKHIASGSWDGTVRLWYGDGSKTQSFFEYKKHSGGVWSVAWAPLSVGKVLASASADGTVHVWQAL